MAGRRLEQQITSGHALASANAAPAVATYETLIPEQRQQLPDLDGLEATLTNVAASTTREDAADKCG